MNKSINKTSPNVPKALSELLRKTLTDTFAKQGFAATELVTRWEDIAGSEIAAHSQPLKLNWPRAIGDAEAEPATLVLRVEGPAALDIQHLSSVIIERVNRFFGWHAVGKIALRQAPLSRPQKKPAARAPNAELTARLAAELPAIADDDLRQALARLGASIKGK